MRWKNVMIKTVHNPFGLSNDIAIRPSTLYVNVKPARASRQCLLCLLVWVTQPLSVFHLSLKFFRSLLNPGILENLAFAGQVSRFSVYLMKTQQKDYNIIFIRYNHFIIRDSVHSSSLGYLFSWFGQPRVKHILHIHMSTGRPLLIQMP